MEMLYFFLWFCMILLVQNIELKHRENIESTLKTSNTTSCTCLLCLVLGNTNEQRTEKKRITFCNIIKYIHKPLGASVPQHTIPIDHKCLQSYLPVTTHANGCPKLTGGLHIAQRHQKRTGQKVPMRLHRLRQCNRVTVVRLKIIGFGRNELWRQRQLHRFDSSEETRFRRVRAVVLNDTFDLDHQTTARLNDHRIAGYTRLRTDGQFDRSGLQHLEEETRNANGRSKECLDLADDGVRVLCGNGLLDAWFGDRKCG